MPLPGTAIRLKFQRVSKISSYLAKKHELLFPTILSVRGSMAGLKLFPDTFRIWESVRGTFFLRLICVLFAFSCIQG